MMLGPCRCLSPHRGGLKCHRQSQHDPICLWGLRALARMLSHSLAYAHAHARAQGVRSACPAASLTACAARTRVFRLEPHATQNRTISASRARPGMIGVAEKVQRKKDE